MPVRTLTRDEKKLLKFRLINSEGLSSKQADDHIKDLLNQVKENHDKQKQTTKHKKVARFIVPGSEKGKS